MFPILGLGERLHPELDAIFVSSPDKTGAQLPPVGEPRKYWDEVNGKLLSQFATLSAEEWLQRHYAMSEEDYAKDPTRNRLAVLLSRTNHMSYHLFHDLCRNCARNLDKAGVPRRVAMELMGRKTESIYSRYRIVDQGEKRVALGRVQDYLRGADSAEHVASTPSTAIQ